MKKTIIIIIICVMVFTIGCEKYDKTSENQNKEVENEKKEELKYDVDNTSDNFSSNDLIYFIMTDRFYDGDDLNNNFDDVNKNDPKAYHGGDLKGIIEKLDYIESLGTTAIWITPVVENEYAGYHGYWTKDFYNVDPHLGTMSNLKKLVEECHKRDIKVILDHVVNHTGYKSPWLNEDDKKDWFHPKKNITNWSDQNQVENGWLAGLPDLNQDNPDVRKYLLDNTSWWIEKTNVDGMRLDTVKHVSKDFWNEFAYTIKQKYPNFYLLGEVWSDNPRYLEQYHKLGIDGLTNYSIYNGIRNAFTRFGKTSTLVNAIKNEKHFSNPDLNGIFIDNHDNKRLVSLAGEYKNEYLKQALTFIMTYPSIPIIYYGTEIGMEGGDDPDNRRDMEWNKINDSEMLSFYKKLVHLRNSTSALKSGKFKLLDYDKYFLSYIRETNNSSVIVIMNVENIEKDVIINVPTESYKYIDFITNNEYTLNNQTLEIKLGPLELLILKSK